MTNQNIKHEIVKEFFRIGELEKGLEYGYEAGVTEKEIEVLFQEFVNEKKEGEEK